MCDNLPSISADQLTRAVAGTLSALDAPEEDEVRANEHSVVKERLLEEQIKAKKDGEGSKSSLQLLECLSASIDPKLSKLQELNEAHMAYTPSTSFYGRARKVSTKSKVPEGTTPKLQSKKYSSRQNYKLLPPQSPNRIHNNLGKLAPQALPQSHVVKLCSHTDPQQGLAGLRPVNLPIGNPSMKPVLVIQTSEILPLLSADSQTKNSSSDAATMDSVRNSASSELRLNSHAATSKTSPSPQMSISLPPNYTISPSPQALGSRLSLSPGASIQEGTKCVAHQLVPFSQINSVIRLPVPLTVTSSSQAGSGSVNAVPMSVSMISLAQQVSQSQCTNQLAALASSPTSTAEAVKDYKDVSNLEVNIALSPASVNFQPESAVASMGPESSFNVLAKETASTSTLNQDMNKQQSVSSSCVTEMLTKSITSPNHANTLNISPPLNCVNNSLHISSDKGHCNVYPVSSPLFLSNSLADKVTSQNPPQGAVSPISKLVPVASCQQFVPRISAIQSLNTVTAPSHGSCGPILILPSQVNQVPLKLTDANQTVVNVHPLSSTSSNVFNLSNVVNLTPTSPSAFGQASLANKPMVGSKLCQHTTHVVSSNKGPASHPNIVKLLQTVTSREDFHNRRAESNVSSLAPSSSIQTSNSCLPMSPPLASKALVHTLSHGDSKPTEAAVACTFTSLSPSKPFSPSSCSNGIPVISTVCSSPASTFPGISHLSNFASQSNTIPMTTSIVTSTDRPGSIKTVAPSKMQLIVVSDPFALKQPHQNSNIRHPGNAIPHSDQVSSIGNPQQLAKASTRVLPCNSMSILTVRNESHTTSCFTAPIATSVSQKTKKETDSLNSAGSLSSKFPNQHSSMSSSHTSALSLGITASGTSLRPRMQPPSLCMRPPHVSLPLLRLGPRSSASGSTPQTPIVGSKLVISPAGISQLQSLMRKQGRSEGYFIISAKRAAAAASVGKDVSAKRPCLSQVVDSPSPASVSSQPQIPSNSNNCNSMSLSSRVLTQSLVEEISAANTVVTESGECVISTKSLVTQGDVVVTTPDKEPMYSSNPINQTIFTTAASVDKIPVSYPSVSHIPTNTDCNDKNSGGSADLVSCRPGSADSDDGEEESDDESVSSSDSRSSSVALVIETNYDSDHQMADDSIPTVENGNDEEKATDSMEKDAPLNLSKDVVDVFGTLEDKNKSNALSSPEEVSNVDLREKESESLSPQSPHDASHLLDSERNSNFCIPQSPLTLTEIIRQQQYKLGLGYPPIPSPHFTANNKEMLPLVHGATGCKSDSSAVSYSSSEIPSSLSDDCTSSHTLMSQHSVSDHQAVYERCLNTPHSFYPHDVVGDIHVHDSSDLEAAMNLQRLRECPPPMSRQHVEESTSSPSSIAAVNVTSPKSPLSLSSMHQMEANTNINPPMTPNTMLINLLNRVPTPLLTNHQDLLTNPSAHETEIRLVDNEMPSMDPSSSKKMGHQLDKSFSDQKTSDNVLSQQSTSREAIFDESSLKIIRSNSDVFVHPQNALDLIASNYLPRSKGAMNNSSNDPLSVYATSNLAENLVSSSKPPQQDLFSDCANVNMTLSSQDYCLNNFSSSLPSTSHQDCYHASSCSVPLTVTVNLDGFTGSSSTNVVQERATVTTSGYVQEATIDQESLTNNFTLLSNNAQEKCGEADILRHLIQNTNTSTQSHLHQPPQHAVGLQFDSSAALFTPQIPDGQFETEMSSSFMHLNQSAEPLHKNLPCSESLFDVSLSQSISFAIPLPPESSMETYNNLDNGSLQASQTMKFSGHSTFENVSIDAETDLQSNSFNNGTSITVYDTGSDAAFETNANSAFERNPDTDFNNSQTDSSFHQTEPNGAFIMSGSLTDIHTSFGGSLDKNETTIHSRFMDANQKIHLSAFREDGEQNELFFGQTNPSQSQAQSNDLHLYDITSMHHSSNDIGYQMSMLQDHQGGLDGQQGVVQPVHEADLSQSILGHQHDLHGHHTKDLQGHHYDFQGQTSHQYPDSTTTTSFPGQQGDMGFIQEHPFPHYYNNGVTPDMPMFSQHCAVASEAPAMLSISNMNCPIPPYSTASAPDLQFGFHPEEVSNDTSEKHPVLPSASFSPPSVADQAATPESGNMNLYNGSFQNMTVYDMYVRGGNTESRSQLDENPVDSGNFCVECNTMYKTQCKFHPCDYVHVSDMPILSHARLTLPTCLKLAQSSVHGHTSTMGVFTKEKLSMRTKFGPLTGAMVSCDKLGSTRSFSLWQTFSGKNVRVIETSDENSSNWLMFVKPARVSAEQNLSAFQHGNYIYFVTRCEIKEGEELLYWFSKDYARMLGINAKPKSAQHQLCPHCHVCKQVFADRKQVRSHIRLQHPKPHINKCSHCSRRFSQVSHLNAHVLAVHLRLKKFMCNHCGKRFNDSSNLRKHVKSHSEERNFKCQMCTKAFRQKAHLQIHMNTHMPVKHEQCGFCGERFTRTFERKQHELQHTKQHKIECQHCSKVFYKQKVYKEHLKIHRNERNFPCGYCGKAFRNKFALTRHGPACKQRKRTLSLAPTSSESLSSMHGQSTTTP